MSLARATLLSDRRDRRHGETWTGVQRAKNDAIYGIVALLLLVLRLVPKPLIVASGRALGRAAFFLLTRERRIALANLSSVSVGTGDVERRVIAKSAFEELGVSLGEVACVLVGGSFEPVVFEETERTKLREAVSEGRGVVFVSAHLGAWERLFFTLKEAGFPIMTVARESYDPRFTRLYDRVRGEGRSLYRGTREFGDAAKVHLRSGQILGIPMDLASRVPSIEIPFLGLLAEVPTGAARLALGTGAVVLVGTLQPGDGGRESRKLTIERISAVSSTSERENSVRDLTTQLAAALARRILAMPEAWLWMHDRFRGGTRRN